MSRDLLTFNIVHLSKQFSVSIFNFSDSVIFHLFLFSIGDVANFATQIYSLTEISRTVLSHTFYSKFVLKPVFFAECLI